MEYYQITHEELADIKAKLPSNVAFGIESYGNVFFSADEVTKIDAAHGEILDLIFMSLYGRTKVNFLNERKSDAFEKYVIQKSKNEDGLDGYEKIIGYIWANDSLGSSLDNEVIPAYKEVTTLRMMMKDGMFETALRYLHVNITPGLLSAELLAFASSVVEELLTKYHTRTDMDALTLIGALKTVPAGSL